MVWTGIFPPMAAYQGIKELAGKEMPSLGLTMPASKKTVTAADGIMVGGGLFGGGKIGEIHAPGEHYAPVTTIKEAAPYQYYQPAIQYSPVTGYQYTGATTIISSPGAVSKKESVMEQVSKPKLTAGWEQPFEVKQESVRKETEMSSLLPIAIVAVIGVVAFGLIKGVKKK